MARIGISLSQAELVPEEVLASGAGEWCR